MASYPLECDFDWNRAIADRHNFILATSNGTKQENLPILFWGWLAEFKKGPRKLRAYESAAVENST